MRGEWGKSIDDGKLKMDNVNKNFREWIDTLTPLYGERETRNMWRWYLEAERPEDMFEEDLKRLAKYYPIQYLTGYAWFYGEKFYVNEHTLIPRPETEELVYKILGDHPSDQNLRVIDLGTGTGCIPITLKRHRPAWKISGLELYEETLHVAQRNDKLHHAGIEWIQGDILDLSAVIPPSYDIIISNPPYISPAEKSYMERNVLDFEPHKALFTDDHEGLEYYKAIAAYGRQSLQRGTKIYLEIHESNSQQIAGLFDDNSFFELAEIMKDIQGKDRILTVNRR